MDLSHHIPNYTGENLVGENSLLPTSCFQLCQCSVASSMNVYHTVKYDVGNCNWGRSATKSRGNVRNFIVPGE